MCTVAQIQAAANTTRDANCSRTCCGGAGACAADGTCQCDAGRWGDGCERNGTMTCIDACASYTGPSGMMLTCAGGFDVYCDSDFDGGGWSLVAAITAPQRMFHLDLDVGSTAASPGGDANWLHPNYAQITGHDVRVGRMVGSGTTVGTILEINDCGSSDAACIYSRRIGQNDGDQFGSWITHGGSFNSMPGGCGYDGCPASGGDRDHDQAHRIAIFGGDCHSNCGDRSHNGFTYADYSTDTATPGSEGARYFWSTGTVTPGQTSLGTETQSSNLDSVPASEIRDVWIR